MQDVKTRSQFGEFLARTRRERGWSAPEVGRMLGISDKQVYRYEHGHNDPSASIVVRLADAVGVSIDEVLGRETPATVDLRLDEVGGKGAAVPPVRLELSIGRRRFVWTLDAGSGGPEGSRNADSEEEPVTHPDEPSIRDAIAAARALGIDVDEIADAGIDVDRGRAKRASELEEAGGSAILRSALAALRMDYAGMALALGVGERNVEEWATGAAEMPTGVLAKLVELLGAELRRRA
jgi:transcriptional regulator with XRE-family HTH domain/DNA-binding transcriptional regulator YdaS (Cro superfamily)